jgi:hypothetical protein
MPPVSCREIRRSYKADNVDPALSSRKMSIRSHYFDYIVHHDQPISVFFSIVGEAVKNRTRQG